MSPTSHGPTPCQVQQGAGRLRFTMEPSLRCEPPCDHDQFDPVSPTAKIVGYLRGFDQALNVHGATAYREEGRRLLDELKIHDAQTRALMSVLFQSRYQAINALLAHGEPPQVIEFAAGISPRGLQWAGSSPGTIYVESDLPRLITHKARLIHDSLLSQCRQLKGFLHCCAVDVLDHCSVQQCIAGLDDETSFAMVTEGLLLYFTEAEMRQVFRNLSVVLHQYPESCWVTDLVTRQHLQELFASSGSVGTAVRRVFSLTGRDVQPNNPFADTAEFMRWLAEFGLRLESSLALQKTTARLCFDVPVSAAQRDRIVGSRQIVRIRSSSVGPAA